MEKKVYIETSVVSYFTSRPSRDLVVAGHQEATRTLWPLLLDRWAGYVSALVYQEAGQGDVEQATRRLEAIEGLPMLDVTTESECLSDKLLAERAVPREFPEDALHIAVAAVNGMDVLLTWNFAHLNNPNTRRQARRVVESEGYACPEICSPDELLESDQ